MITSGLGSPGDTWGISGPNFSALYLTAMVACAAVMALLQRILAGRNKGDISMVKGLEPEEIALLTRDDAAVATALASLSATKGRVSMTKRGRWGGPDAVAGLRVAVRNAHSSGRVQAFSALTRDPEVKAALDALRADLRDRGLLLTPVRRALLQMRFVLPLALTLVGLARVIAGWQNHKPIVQILAETIVMAVATGISALSCRTESPATRPARRALVEMRRASPELLPEAMKARHAGFATTRTAAPMSVALFGTAALVHADPALAETLHIPTVQYAAMPAAGGGGSSGSSCSSSSSCGGGCGGGSSCGG